MATLEKKPINSPRMTLTLPSDTEVLLTREIAAPRRLVFKAYGDRDMIPHWWGPRACKTRVDKLDFRVGGAWRFVNIAADGTEHAFRGVYKEIVPDERLVYTFEYEAMAGHILTEALTFEDRGDRTLVVNRSKYASKADRDGMLASGMEEGASETLDRLEEQAQLSGESTFAYSRVVAAPRTLVWKAHTQAEHLKNWWGPKGSRVEKAELDLRPGGRFHFLLRMPDDSPMWARFVYREVSPEERLVFVLSFSDAEGGITRHPMAPEWPAETLIMATLADAGGKTKVTLRATPIGASGEESGIFKESFASMESGYAGTYDKLEALLGQIEG